MERDDDRLDRLDRLGKLVDDVTVEHFDVAMVATAMAANEMKVPLASGETRDAIALDFGGYDPETDARVVCRIVLVPDAITEMVERLASLEDGPDACAHVRTEPTDISDSHMRYRCLDCDWRSRYWPREGATP